MTTSPYKPETRSQSFRRKLSYYVIGLAIGFFILGAVTIFRQREAARTGPQPTRPGPGPSAAPVVPGAPPLPPAH